MEIFRRRIQDNFQTTLEFVQDEILHAMRSLGGRKLGFFPHFARSRAGASGFISDSLSREHDDFPVDFGEYAEFRRSHRIGVVCARFELLHRRSDFGIRGFAILQVKPKIWCSYKILSAE